MSANEQNRFIDIRWPNHFKCRHFISTGAQTDQSVLAATDPSEVAQPHPPPLRSLRQQLNGVLHGIEPRQQTREHLLREKCQQNAIPRASATDVMQPWQIRAVPRGADPPSMSMSGAKDPNHDGPNALRFSKVNNSFDDEAKTARNAIIIIDERALVRDCLVYCLQAKYVSHAVFAFATLSEWMKVENDFPAPSVILLCVQTRQKKSLNDSDDVEVLARVAVSAPLIIVSDVEDGSRIMRAIESGARGYIPTSMTLGIAVEAVRLVEAGGTFVPISVMSSFQNSGNGESQLFTARQIMVVEALCRGKSNKQISYELGMCESNVKVHIRHIMRKLKARNRTEVAMMVSTLFDKIVDQKSVSNT